MRLNELISRLRQPTKRMDATNGKPVVDVLSDNLINRLAPSAIDLLDDDCVAFSGTEWLRIWTVRSWPRTLGYGNWRKLLHFPADVRISLHIFPVAPGAVSRQLEGEETHIQATRQVRMQMRRDPSPSDDQALAEIRAERYRVEVKGEPYFNLNVSMALFADTREHLEAWSRKLENICRDAGLQIDRSRWQHEDGMAALLPLNQNTMGMHERNVTLDALTNLFPFTGEEIITPDGLFYGYDIHTHKAMTLDPFELVNPNCIIVGSSGGGKSFWMKDTIEQLVLDGTRVFVLDIEDEYRRLCDDLGGVYLDMGVRSKHKINVLEPDPNDPEGLAGAFQMFCGWLYSVLQRALSPEERQVLARAYSATFRKNELAQKDKDPLNRAAPLLSDLHDELREMANNPREGNHIHAGRLADVLWVMSHDLEAEAFNCQTNINIHSNPLVVFGFSTVKETMMARRIRQVQQFTLSEMTRPGLDRTVEIVDEAWWLLQTEATASDLAARVRRFRKKNSAIFIATQHVADFAANPEAHTILGLVGMQLLFQQNPSSLQDVARAFQLNPTQQNCVRDLRQGQYLLKTNHLSTVVHKPVPQSRYRLYTTKPSEVLDDGRPSSDDRLR